MAVAAAAADGRNGDSLVLIENRYVNFALADIPKLKYSIENKFE